MKIVTLLFLTSGLALGQQPTNTQPSKPASSSAGDKCVKGAGNALKATAIATGIGCVIDLFVSGGALCTLYLTTALANAPTAAAAGCVVGAIATPAAGTAVGSVTAPHVVLDATSDAAVESLPTN